MFKVESDESYERINRFKTMFQDRINKLDDEKKMIMVMYELEIKGLQGQIAEFDEQMQKWEESHTL